MSITKKVLIGLSIIVFYIGLMFTQNLFDSYAQLQRTGRHTSVSTITGPAYLHNGDNKPMRYGRVRQGDMFEIHSELTRSDACIIDSSTALLGLNNKEFYLFSSFTSWNSTGPNDRNEINFMPEKMPLGHYHVVKKTVSHCSGVDYFTISFDVPLEVVAKEAK